MRRSHRLISSALGVAVLVFSGLVFDSTVAGAASFTSLTLENGWTNAPFGTSNAAIKIIGGVVQLKGAIAGGTSPEAFTLPAAFRPATEVYVPIDTCNATNGRLQIEPSGAALVEAETDFSNAQCFTSLDGASFSLTTKGYKSLALENGWTNAPFGTSDAAAKKISGVVHLKGAIASGTSAEAFTLPAAFRPATEVYVPIDMCNATNGRLLIEPSGVTTVEAESDFTNAQCFTSLDGASFSLTTKGYQSLALENGWTNAPFGTSDAAAKKISGVVHLKGAIASGTSAEAFTLPAAFRPATEVYVPIDMCNATNGRLLIEPSGAATVEAESDFTNAQCFTSLDGAAFAP